MIDFLLQWAGAAGILAGLFLMERKSLWAPVLLGIGAVLMGLFGWSIEAYGVVATNFGAAILNIRAFWVWRKA
jgi:hypothetical protein